MKAEQQERMQIAMDLHDEIGALMTVLKINNHNAKNEVQDNLPLFRVLNEASGLIEQTADAIRNISNRISPPALAKLGLEITLKELITTINSTGKIQINYFSHLENRRFKIAAELNLYRILKETINNILKHGQTTKLLIQANQSAEFVEFEFNYQGRGLTNEQVNELLRVSDRNGLKSIQSRVNNLNASISYLCSENGNASIHLKIPFHAIKD
jgi:signal transduction histidine kinase